MASASRSSSPSHRIARRSKAVFSCLVLSSLLPVELHAQQTYSGTFSGAFQVTVPQNQGSPAVPAQCPSQAPQSCSNIGEPNWCCPSGNYCGYNQGSVGCCPYSQQCSGYGGGAAQPSSSYAYTSWQPTTTYQPPATTTNYNYGGVVGFVGVATVYTSQQQQQQPQQQQTQQGGAGGVGYCSTLFANGPGLPTERPGQCGTILILQAAGKKRWKLTGAYGWIAIVLGAAWGLGWGVLLLR